MESIPLSLGEPAFQAEGKANGKVIRLGLFGLLKVDEGGHYARDGEEYKKVRRGSGRNEVMHGHVADCEQLKFYSE